MVAVSIIAVVVATLLVVTFVIIRDNIRSRKVASSQSNENSRVNSSRGNYLLSICIGYLLSAFILMALLVLIEGLEGFSIALFMFTYSILFAAPVFLVATIIGYPLYRRCRDNSTGLIRIWLAYSAAAVASGLVIALIATFLQRGSIHAVNAIFESALFLCISSLLVAVPTSVYTWIRQRA